MLSDWDVLIFLYKHHASLTSAEHIARLIGYPSKTVGIALERLESRQMVQRSRPSQGVRLYQVAFLEQHLAPGSCFRQLIGFAENRSGRLLLVKHLRQSAALPVVMKGNTK
jgi:hypothetical protein